MANQYPFILFLLLTGSAAAQTVPADTLRPPFRGTLPDSLATAPTPAGTFRVQGQEQPIRPFLTIQEQLRTVAGVQVTPYEGSPGSGAVVRIRGASVAQGLAQPLYVIDGLPALNDELAPDRLFAPSAPPLPFDTFQGYEPTVSEGHAEAGANPLLLLPPETIESIEVLAGPAAVARYGPLGANGVISIRTRRSALAAGRPLRVRYSAQVGVQQLRQRYELLGASEFAQIVNAAAINLNVPAGNLPFPNTSRGAGTDWQAETYRLAGLQQHQLSLEGGSATTAFVLSTSYRQQSGVLRNTNLHDYGLRLALDQRLGPRLILRGTAALNQTDQRLPYTMGYGGATRAALLAPPTEAVRNDRGDYNGYGQYGGLSFSSFANPVALAEYTYRTPRTQRLLGQLAADYELAPHLSVQASVNFQRTLLEAASYRPPYVLTGPSVAPTQTQQFATQTYRASQLASRLALRYQRQLGERHLIGAEIDYQYQSIDYTTRTEFGFGGRFGYNEFSAETNLKRPWARLFYRLDSTLDVEASVSRARYWKSEETTLYPAGQVSWHLRPIALPAGLGPAPLTLWVGAARTSTFSMGYGFFGPIRFGPGFAQQQAPLYTDQGELGLRLGVPGARFSGQLVAYQRTSRHVPLSTRVPVPSGVGQNNYFYIFDEGTMRNQGLELTLSASWQAGHVQGATQLAASANRNRLQAGEAITRFNPEYDNHPTGTFYGFQQNGLTADGRLRFRDLNGDGNPNASLDFQDRTVLGGGIPAQLLSLSQQLRQGRLALDLQIDGMFGYQLLNHQLALLDTPSGFTNNATTVRDYWTPTHTNTTVPAPGLESSFAFSSDYFLSDRLIENAGHVRLTSLTLTYRLRQTATQDLSVWVGGQNLLVLSHYRGYDPNVSSGGSAAALAGQDYGATPVPRTWLLGVRAEF